MSHRNNKDLCNHSVNSRGQFTEMHTAVLLCFHFALHAVNMMSHSKPVIMLTDVTCQIGCVEGIVTINFQQCISFSVDMH